MIRITRPPEPEFLRAVGNKWLEEDELAAAHYSTPGVTKSFEFKHYRDQLIKEALKKVFSKCAYCECVYAHVYDGDVEHFRPKGKVKEKDPQTPGYYWLANKWTNLLLSCQHCNQSRKHILEGETIAKAYGKLDQFPLSDETKRAHKSTDSLEEEDTVPSADQPMRG